MDTASFQGRRCVVITASDRCYTGHRQDRSGPAVVAVLQAAGAASVEQRLLPDDPDMLIEALRTAATYAGLVLTTGGTGLSPRDNTPEATLAVCERLVPGLPEIIREEGRRHTPFAALSRGVAGVCGRCLIVNLPGSPGGAVQSLHAILSLLPHALDLLAGTPDPHGVEPRSSRAPRSAMADDTGQEPGRR